MTRTPKNVRLSYSALAITLLALPFVLQFGLGRGWVRIIDLALLYSMLALGLNIVVGYAGLLDLGYIAFYAMGAYVYALLNSPQFGLHWPVWVVLPLGAACAGLFGVLLGTPTLRLRGDYLAIVTLGFGEIIRIFLNNLNEPINITNGPQGISLIDPIHIGTFSFSHNHTQWLPGLTGPVQYYYLFLAITLLIMWVALRLQHSRVGRAWAAIREDELAAAASGIALRNYKLLAFAMGATFGGLAGGLFAGFQGFVSPESFNLMESVMILCMIVLGGMGNVFGVVLGALILTAFPEALRMIGQWQLNQFGRVVVDPNNFRMLLFGMALVVMMLLRPAGLWPSRRHHREYAGERS